MKKIFDLSHKINSGMQVYPGDPKIQLSEYLVHDKDYCHVDQVNLGSHSGTHIDAPFHFIGDGKTIDQFPISTFCGKGIVLDFQNKKENQSITKEEIKGKIEGSVFSIENLLGKGCLESTNLFVIINTGWDTYWGMPQYVNHPYIQKSGAEYLRDKGFSIVGTDCLNIDSTVNEVWDAHRILLENDILIVENLNNLRELDSFEKTGKIYEFFFIPLNLEGSDGAPIRGFAME